MASTYTWAEAITAAKQFTKSLPSSTIDAVLCDQLNALIWKRFYWRWAVASLTSASGVLNLVQGVQDYAIGTTTGAGFYRLVAARITRFDVTPFVAREKDVIYGLTPNLEATGGMDSIEAIGPMPASATGLRLDCAASVPTGTTYRIDGEYQFRPVKITTTTSVIVFPDDYFDVAVQGMIWKYYQLGDDSRNTGQMGVFHAALNDMAAAEDLGDGRQMQFPDNPIGVGRGWWGG